MTPRTQAIAYRIWAYASPKGWDCTFGEVAEAIDATTNTVRAICQHRGWHNRMRSVSPRDIDVMWGYGPNH